MGYATSSSSIVVLCRWRAGSVIRRPEAPLRRLPRPPGGMSGRRSGFPPGGAWAKWFQRKHGVVIERDLTENAKTDPVARGSEKTGSGRRSHRAGGRTLHEVEAGHSALRGPLRTRTGAGG